MLCLESKLALVLIIEKAFFNLKLYLLVVFNLRLYPVLTLPVTTLYMT
jgi:hypothetical protein